MKVEASMKDMFQRYGDAEADEEEPLESSHRNLPGGGLKVGHYTYLTLFKVALDFLIIPSTSCDCERSFSGGRRTVSIHKNSLFAATIEALQLQKNWLRQLIVKSQLSELTDHISRLNGSHFTPTSSTSPPRHRFRQYVVRYGSPKLVT
jgi:hypothetical protein